MKKLSVALLTIIACCMLWACGKTATFNESEEETTTHKKNKTEYSTTAEDITESSERQTYSDSDYKTGITFDNISRNPKDYEGKLVYFTGEVVQLMEGDDENQIRLAVDGDYDKMILIGYDPEITTSRILEDDNIEIYGTSVGIFQYESVLGQTISIPAVYVDKINLINGNQNTPNEPVNQPAKQPVEQPAEQPAKQPAEQPAPPATKPAAQPTTPASNVSAGESNALKSAKSYLDMGGFSKESLKGQLEYEGCDYDTIVCMFIIFSDIIKSTDVVPKLLLMKYYIEVIMNPTAKEDDYRLLFNINLLATCFSAGSGNKKQTTVFAPIVLSDNWKKKLEDSAIKIASSFGKQVKVNKMILENGKSTEKSGQYLAQRISGIIYSYELKNSKIKINQTRFKEFRTATNFNDEHFFIHQKNKVIAKYKNNDIMVEYPSKCWKKVSFLCNYLRLNKEVNRKIGNYFILKKIDMIDQELRNNVKVFADEKSKMIFREAKRIFIESECPTEKAINDCDTIEEAKNMLNKYYSNSFEKDYMKLAKIIELPQTL